MKSQQDQTLKQMQFQFRDSAVLRIYDQSKFHTWHTYPVNLKSSQFDSDPKTINCWIEYDKLHFIKPFNFKP